MQMCIAPNAKCQRVLVVSTRCMPRFKFFVLRRDIYIIKYKKNKNAFQKIIKCENLFTTMYQILTMSTSEVTQRGR